MVVMLQRSWPSLFNDSGSASRGMGSILAYDVELYGAMYPSIDTYRTIETHGCPTSMAFPQRGMLDTCDFCVSF